MTWSRFPGAAGGPLVERRSNVALREVLDEFLQLSRRLARQARQLPDEERARIVSRLEWLADEVVHLTTGDQ